PPIASRPAVLKPSPTSVSSSWFSLSQLGETVRPPLQRAQRARTRGVSMSDLRIASANGFHATIEESTIQTLRSALRGNLISPGDAYYDEARTIFNAMIDRRPALIARCAGASDVVECVRFARARQLILSVRGTGHNVAGVSICDDGFVIDLSRMKSIRVHVPHT